MPSTLRSQISLAFGLLVLVLSAALSFGLAGEDERVELTDQGDALYLLAHGAATVLSEGLFERMREVELLAAAPPYAADGEIDVQMWAPVLERAQSTRPQFSWIGVTDKAGQVLFATGGLLVGVDVSARPWCKGASARPYIGDVHPAKLLASLLPPSITGEPLRFLDFAAPLANRAGMITGVIGVHASWDWAHEVVTSMRSRRNKDGGVQVFVLNRAGDVIYHPQEVPANVHPLDWTQLSTEGGLELPWSDHKHYLTAAARHHVGGATSDLGWTVVTRQPIEIARASAAQTRLTIMGFGALGALFAMALAWWLAGRFSRSLVAISRAARRVQAGELRTEIPAIHDILEVSQLASALRGMTSTLLEREQALARANEELEARVSARTAELAAAREHLLKANETLEALAQKDGLTGLFNRRVADSRLQMEFARHRRTGGTLAVLLLDIDHFKSINDTFGHPAGDEVLKLVSAKLLATCRSTDFVARFGGEEFLMLLPETGPEGAKTLAEKLREAVADMTEGPRPVTLSIGVANAAEQWVDEAAALRSADEALYAAKQGGRNRVVAHSGERAA